MYDTIIIGAGMSRAGGRHSAGVLRPAGLHSRAALHDRRAELVLPPPRPRLRRRPARAHQLHAQGHEDRPARPAAAAAAAALGRLRDRAADRLGDRVSRRAAAVRQRRRNAARRSRLRVSRSRPTTSIGSSREIVEYDDLERDARQHLGPRGRRLDHHRAAAGRDAVLPADVLRLGPRARHGLGPVLDHVPQHLSGGPRPAARRRAADPQAPGAKVPRAGRRAEAAQRREAAGRRERPRDARRARERRGARSPQRRVVGRLVRDDAAVRRRPAGRHVARPGPAHASAKRSPRSTSSRSDSATTARSRSSTTTTSSSGRSRTSCATCGAA